MVVTLAAPAPPLVTVMAVLGACLGNVAGSGAGAAVTVVQEWAGGSRSKWQPLAKQQGVLSRVVWRLD